MNVKCVGIMGVYLVLSSLCLADVTPVVKQADPWLDEVISFVRPEGSSSQGGVATEALGANDNKTVSVDIPEVLILAFTDNTAWNGDGVDITVYQYWPGDSDVDIYASEDNISYVYLGRTDSDASYDLGSLSYANYIKFVGVDDGGSAAGYELDAVLAKYSVAHIGVNTVPVPGACLLGMAGVSCLGWMRRRNRTLR